MKKLFNFKLLTLSIFVWFLLMPPFASAQQELQIIVGPVRQEVFLDPGETDNVEVRFYNQSNEVISGIVNVVDFVVTSTDGAPKLIDDADTASPKFSGSKWVNLPYDRIDIAPGSKVAIPITISIPQDAAPGGRYVAVYFQPGNTTPTTSGSGVSSRIASLLYIRINGEITENAIITRFYTPSIFEYGPITVNTEILNRGDYHIAPKAIVAMTNAFGSLTDQVVIKEQNIFPETSRIFTTEVGPKWLFGRYKLSLMGTYGAHGKALEAVTYAWVIPYRVIAVIILALLLVYILLRKIITGSHQQVSDLQTKLSQEEKELNELKKQLRRKNE